MNKLGLEPGFAFDLLENDPFDGKSWNFKIKEKRDRVYEKVKREKPFLLVGCPPRTAFSTLFESSIEIGWTQKDVRRFYGKLVYTLSSW